MQKRAYILIMGRAVGILCSLLIHVALIKAWSSQKKDAQIELDQGTMAVELTLRPSIASVATVVKKSAPTPVLPEPIDVFEKEPLEEESDLALPSPEELLVPTNNVPKKIVHLERSPEPENILEESQQQINAIEQTGSVEQHKGVEMVAQPTTAYALHYPTLSRRRGEEGTVSLAATIDIEGRASKIAVKQSSGYKRLDRAAIHALEKARFHPATKNGKPISSTHYETFKFNLHDEQ